MAAFIPGGGYFCGAVRIFYSLFFLVFLLFAPRPASAQWRLHYAHTLWSQKRYDAAIQLLQKKLHGRAQEASFYSTLGGWNFWQGRYAAAAEVFEVGAQKTQNGDRNFSLPLARAYFRAGQYSQAARQLQGHPPQSAEGKWLLKAAVWAAAQPREAVFPQSLGVRINTQFPESFPQLAIDGRVLYYTRRSKGMDDDLLRSLPDSCGGWFTGVALPVPLNSSRQERAQTLSADGHYIFFGREEIQSENGWEGGGGDLYMSYTTTPGDTAWSVPQPFGATINTPAYEGMPTLSADNKTLFFVSDRPGGRGGLDIWYSHFENGRWQPPANAGPEINTPQNEVSPFLAADGKTLFFASDGQPQNFGGYDLYRATISGNRLYEVRNLGLPLNSPHNEISPFVGLRGDTLYFATDREGPPGNTDIWVSDLPPALRPAAMRAVAGQVVDSLSGEALPNAWVRLSEAATGVETGGFRSNRGDGSFVAFLEINRPYDLEAKQIGYQRRTNRVLLQPEDTTQPWARLALLPQNYVAPRYDSLLLRFSFRKSEVLLNDTLKAALNALNPALLTAHAEILVWSFTDDSGTPMINEEISQLRARLVADVLIKQGFPAEKITAQGWGEQYPMAPNESEEERYRNRRVEVILRK